MKAIQYDRAGKIRMLIAALCASWSLQVVAADTPAEQPIAAGQLEVLKLIPDDVVAAIVISKLANVDVNVARLSAAIKIPIPAPLAMGKGILGIKDGIDLQGSAAFVGVATAEDKAPEKIAFLPVSDYSTLIGQLMPEDQGSGISSVKLAGQTMLVGRKNSYAVITSNSPEARKQLERVLARPEGISTSIAPLQGWVAERDVALIVTTSGIKAFVGGARKVFASVRQSLPQDNPRFQMAQQSFEIYDKLLGGIEQGVSQSAFGLKVEDNGTLRLSSRSRFVEGSELAKLGSGATSPSSAPLSGVPSGPYLMAYHGTIGANAIRMLSDFLFELMKSMPRSESAAKLTDDDSKQFADAMQKSMQGLRSMSMVMGVPQEGKSLYDNTYGVLKVDDSKTYMENYAVAMSLTSKFYDTINSPMLAKLNVQKIEFEGVAGLQIEMDVKQMLANATRNQPPGAPNMNAMFETMFGASGKFSTYLVPADQQTVVMVWNEKDHLKQAIAASKTPSAGLATDPGVKATASLLPAGSQWVGFISPAGIMKFGQIIMKTAAPQLAAKIPNFPETQPLGFAARADSGLLDTEFVVPADTLKGIGEYVQQMQSAAGPGRAN
jgi:hypothetical protein